MAVTAAQLLKIIAAATFTGAKLWAQTIGAELESLDSRATALENNTALTGDTLNVGGGELVHTIGGVEITSSAEVHSDGNADLGALVVHRHTNTEAFGAHILSLTSRGTHVSETVVTDTQTLARFLAAGFDGVDYALGAEIRMVVDGTPGVGDMPTSIVFLTSADGAESPTEHLRITPAGDTVITSLKTGTHSALSGETASGYITITDSGGTPRKLSVVS